jgi:hypothetical protein
MLVSDGLARHAGFRRRGLALPPTPWLRADGRILSKNVYLFHYHPLGNVFHTLDRIRAYPVR